MKTSDPLSAESQPGRFLRQASMAVVMATGFFVCFVLPAEYDVDPLGVGALMGIKGMSKTKSLTIMSSSVDGEPLVPDAKPHSPANRPLQFTSVDIALEAFGQAEYKFTMAAGDSLAYTWKTNGGVSYAELHGHTMTGEGELLIEYLKSDSVAVDSGTIRAPFSGEHGWYFLNLTQSRQVITLEVSGNFSAQQLTDLGSQLP